MNIRVAELLEKKISGSRQLSASVKDVSLGVLLSSLVEDPEFLKVFKAEAFRLFVDMDGVLTDWLKQYEDFSGRPFDESKDITWGITNNLEFWSTMKWLPKGRALWDALKPLSPVILSAPASSTHAVDGKTLWVQEHIGRDVRYVFENEKWIYADARSILIDDMDRNIEPWEENGGIAIKYTGNPTAAIKELKKKVLSRY